MNNQQGMNQNQVYQMNNNQNQAVQIPATHNIPANQNQPRNQGNVAVTTQHEGSFDWSNHEEDIVDDIRRANVAFMAIDSASSSKVHSDPNADLPKLVNELKEKIGKLESECFKKQSIINAYEASEIVSEERMKSLEEDCMNSYRAQTRFTTEISGLKKMLQTENEFLKNLVSTGNICGILNKVKEDEKYKAVPPPFNNNFMPKVDKEKRSAYLQQFKDVFQDKEDVADLYKNVEVSEDGEFVMKKEMKEEKSIGVQVSEDDFDSDELDQDDLNDEADNVPENERKDREERRKLKGQEIAQEDVEIKKMDFEMNTMDYKLNESESETKRVYEQRMTKIHDREFLSRMVSDKDFEEQENLLKMFEDKKRLRDEVINKQREVPQEHCISLIVRKGKGLQVLTN
ncbi:uncharacterized protein LOC143620613 [Bidens hawaiensis]|uniref:uncharacterized protein LOC143620613 n=1 Tax=Bidens hawaiensis TaxID=980011 RepID=UPI00404AAB5E